MPDSSNRIDARDKAEILAQALPYIRKFHGKTLVIKYGGNAMTDPALQADFAEDVVLLRLVGMNPVVVHGGGKVITDWLAKQGVPSQFVQGERVTDQPTLEVVVSVLAGAINTRFVAAINAAGGSADSRSRQLAKVMSTLLGQPIIVDNKAGAGGNIGTEMIARGKPDGYTLGMGNFAPLAVNHALFKKLNFDPLNDIVPIALIERGPLVLMVALSANTKLLL